MFEYNVAPSDISCTRSWAVSLGHRKSNFGRPEGKISVALREGTSDAMADRGRTVAWPTPTAKTALGPSPIHCLFPAPCPQRILSICCGPFCIRIAFCKTQHALPSTGSLPLEGGSAQIREFPGVGCQAKGGAAMTFADGIGNLSSRKKEPTHAFDEQRTTEFAPCRP